MLINSDAANAILSSPGCGIPVELVRARDPSMLWLNPRAKEYDHTFQLSGTGGMSHRQHLLNACAFVIPEADSALRFAGQENALGFADRYGGSGVGNNGGSGRSVLLNGYCVKGIGRTPLVSARTPTSHAAGGAYLEECIREVIFSEIVYSEFPHSAVPILAVIDTGLIQRWDTENGPKYERRVLLVRPCFLRPAHFERAIGFISGQKGEGLRDANRVRQMFAKAREVLGSKQLENSFDRLGTRLAEQLAYGFVHRLAHGSPNSSNVTLGGQLLDFGAMSALPSWADVATMLRRRPFEKQFEVVAQTIRSLNYYRAKYLQGSADQAAAGRQQIEAAQKAFKSKVVSEVFRIFGVSRSLVTGLAAESPPHITWGLVAPLLLHFQREKLDFVDNEPTPQLAWDICEVWNDLPPKHLRNIKAYLLDHVPVSQLATAQAASASISRTRSQLFREAMKARLYLALDAPGALADESTISRLVAAEVKSGRRDFDVDD
jgi:Protein adenylyltransferase SelO